MKTTTPLSLALAFVLLASACINLEGNDMESPRKFSYSPDADCVCGDTGNLTGCFHEKCIEGENNPDNEHCVCGGLSVTHTGLTQTSTGAQAPSKLLGKSQILYLARGNTVRGVLVADNGLTIELKSADGSTRTFSYEELDPRSIYRLKKGQAPEGNAEAQIEVGNYARDVGYYAHARRHYQQAVKDDAAVEGQVDEELAKLRQLASQGELTAASDALGKGDMKMAETHITTILKEFPDETAATSAAAMLNDIQAKEASVTRSVPDMSAEVAADFAKALKTQDKSVEENRKGLMNSSKHSTSLRHFDNSLKESNRVHREIDAVMKRNRDSAAHQKFAQQLNGEANSQIIATDLNMVSVYMTRSDYQKALERVNHALAIDPSNAEAKQARSRIEMASSNDGWGWGYGGRGGRVRPRRR
jgi:tetratricopeptide (TPR) repeat protein